MVAGFVAIDNMCAAINWQQIIISVKIVMCAADFFFIHISTELNLPLCLFRCPKFDDRKKKNNEEKDKEANKPNNSLEI